jgi:hypothetical protein
VRALLRACITAGRRSSWTVEESAIGSNEPRQGKRRLSGDTARQATSPEVKELRSESLALKECVADLTLENRLLKKSMIGDGATEE